MTVASATIIVHIVWILVAFAHASAISPSVEQAELDTFPIFNSIHSALRQWGGTVDHNGLAFIPAKVSKDVLLYHGTHSSDLNTTGVEWLAFEIERSEIFAFSWRARRKRGLLESVQAALQRQDSQVHTPEFPSPASPPAIRGYLRTYQAARDLNVLYLDGMSAA